MVARCRPVPPTSSLPPLVRLPTYSLTQITQAINNLRAIYCPPALTALPVPKALPKHFVHDISVPDSGYASAEGEEEEEDQDCEEDPSHDPDILQSDILEREFAIRWLTGFTARSDTWVYASGCSDAEVDAREALVDTAASLLGSFAGQDEEEAVLRTFTFPTSQEAEVVHVELNDAALLSNDHTSVGLQSWGSSIRLAERICFNPAAFGLAPPPQHGRDLRVLELGAGTGLLSLAVAKLLVPTPHMMIVATDYHPLVLDNLRENVDRNVAPLTPAVEVLPLDWRTPEYVGPLVHTFDVILAADVVYHSDHARWIKGCVEHILARPSSESEGEQGCGGVFWLIVPLRSTGRHEGISETVEAVFPHALAASGELAILSMEEFEKRAGIGRADEGGYKLYGIGWV